MAGKNIGFIHRAGHLDSYRPLLTSYNIPIGYVMVSISTESGHRMLRQFVLRLVVAVALMSLVITLFVMRLFDGMVVKPIKDLSEALTNYVRTMGDEGGQSTLANLSIHTGDEIEDLYYSLGKMESKLMQSTSSLAIATWNSEHDSMTKLYNKRYLKDYLEIYNPKESMAAIYCDVNNLKKMNDICGHEAGDEFLMVLYDKTKKEVEELVE